MANGQDLVINARLNAEQFEQGISRLQGRIRNLENASAERQKNVVFGPSNSDVADRTKAISKELSAIQRQYASITKNLVSSVSGKPFSPLIDDIKRLSVALAQLPEGIAAKRIDRIKSKFTELASSVTNTQQILSTASTKIQTEVFKINQDRARAGRGELSFAETAQYIRAPREVRSVLREELIRGEEQPRILTEQDKANDENRKRDQKKRSDERKAELSVLRQEDKMWEDHQKEASKRKVEEEKRARADYEKAQQASLQSQGIINNRILGDKKQFDEKERELIKSRSSGEQQAKREESKRKSNEQIINKELREFQKEQDTIQARERVFRAVDRARGKVDLPSLTDAEKQQQIAAPRQDFLDFAQQQRFSVQDEKDRRKQVAQGETAEQRKARETNLAYTERARIEAEKQARLSEETASRQQRQSQISRQNVNNQNQLVSSVKAQNSEQNKVANTTDRQVAARQREQTAAEKALTARNIQIDRIAERMRVLNQNGADVGTIGAGDRARLLSLGENEYRQAVARINSLIREEQRMYAAGIKSENLKSQIARYNHAARLANAKQITAEEEKQLALMSKSQRTQFFLDRGDTLRSARLEEQLSAKTMRNRENALVMAQRFGTLFAVSPALQRISGDQGGLFGPVSSMVGLASSYVPFTAATAPLTGAAFIGLEIAARRAEEARKKIDELKKSQVIVGNLIATSDKAAISLGNIATTSNLANEFRRINKEFTLDQTFGAASELIRAGVTDMGAFNKAMRDSFSVARVTGVQQADVIKNAIEKTAEFSEATRPAAIQEFISAQALRSVDLLADKLTRTEKRVVSFQSGIDTIFDEDGMFDFSLPFADSLRLAKTEMDGIVAIQERLIDKRKILKSIEEQQASGNKVFARLGVTTPSSRSAFTPFYVFQSYEAEKAKTINIISETENALVKKTRQAQEQATASFKAGLELRSKLQAEFNKKIEREEQSKDTIRNIRFSFSDSSEGQEAVRLAEQQGKAIEENFKVQTLFNNAITPKQQYEASLAKIQTEKQARIRAIDDQIQSQNELANNASSAFANIGSKIGASLSADFTDATSLIDARIESARKAIADTEADASLSTAQKVERQLQLNAAIENELALRQYLKSLKDSDVSDSLKAVEFDKYGASQTKALIEEQKRYREIGLEAERKAASLEKSKPSQVKTVNADTKANEDLAKQVAENAEAQEKLVEINRRYATSSSTYTSAVAKQIAEISRLNDILKQSESNDKRVGAEESSTTKNARSDLASARNNVLIQQRQKEIQVINQALAIQEQLAQVVGDTNAVYGVREQIIKRQADEQKRQLLEERTALASIPDNQDLLRRKEEEIKALEKQTAAQLALNRAEKERQEFQSKQQQFFFNADRLQSNIGASFSDAGAVLGIRSQRASFSNDRQQATSVTASRLAVAQAGISLAVQQRKINAQEEVVKELEKTKDAQNQEVIAAKQFLAQLKEQEAQLQRNKKIVQEQAQAQLDQLAFQEGAPAAERRQRRQEERNRLRQTERGRQRLERRFGDIFDDRGNLRPLNEKQRAKLEKELGPGFALALGQDKIDPLQKSAEAYTASAKDFGTAVRDFVAAVASIIPNKNGQQNNGPNQNNNQGQGNAGFALPA